MGRKESKIDYFRSKNYNQMNSLERDNALHELERQADELQVMQEFKKALPATEDQNKTQDFLSVKKKTDPLGFRNVELGLTVGHGLTKMTEPVTERE